MASIGSLEFETVIKTDSLKKSEEEIKKAVSDITQTVKQQSQQVTDSNKAVQQSADKAAKSADKTMNSVSKTAEKIVKENTKAAETVNQTISETAAEIVKTGEKAEEILTKEAQAAEKLGETMSTIPAPDEMAKTLDDLLDQLEKMPSNIDSVAKGFDELSEQNTKRMAELDGELEQLNKDLKQLSDDGKGGGDGAKNIQKRIALIKDEISERKDFQKSIAENQKALKDNEFAAVKKSADDYADSIADAIVGNNKFGQSMVNLGKSGKGIGGIFEGLKIGAQSLGKTLTGLMANPAFLAIAGVAGVAAGFKWWFDYNKGVEEATRKTQQLTALSGTELKDFRAEVSAIADTFGKEFDEVLLATNALTKQMGIDAKSALDIVKDGFIVGADVNGEYLDTLKEYPAYFKEAGLNAKQFVAITAMGAKDGVFSDKAVDAIKEANLRLREMPDATKQAIDGIGLSSKAMMDALKKGNITTFDAMQQISAKMAELPEQSSAVGTAIADIFGGPGEDAGLKFLTTIKDIDGNLEKMKSDMGETTQMQDALVQSNIELEQKIAEVFDQTGGVFESLTTNCKIFLNDALIWVIDGVKDMYNWFVDMWNESENFRKSIGSNWAATKLVFKGLWDVIKGLGKNLAALGRMITGAITFDGDEIKKGYNDMILATAEFATNISKTWDSAMNDAEKIVSTKLKRIEKDVKESAQAVEPKKTTKPKEPPIKLEDLLAKRKQQYADYAAAIASTDEDIVAAGIKSGKSLLKSGETWEIYLNNLRKKYKGNVEAIKKINAELLELQSQSQMDIWQNQTGDNVNLGKNITEQLAAYQKARDAIAKDDPLRFQKNDWIDDQIRELVKSASADYVDAQKAQREFAEQSKKEWEKYADDLAAINKKIAETTDADELSILNNQKSATEIRMQLAKNQERIDMAKQLTDKLVAIELERQRKIQEIQSDESLSSAVKGELIAQAEKNAKNDIKLARNEFAEVDGDFVQTMLNDMQSVMGQQMQFYVDKIQELQTKLKSMSPDSQEYMVLNAQLQALMQSYDNLKAKSLTNTKKMARDKSLKLLKDSMNEFGDQLQDIGGEIGGVAGDVISATGQMFNGVVSLTSSITRFAEINTQVIEGVSETGVKAIKAVEKGSVILAIIGTVLQLIEAFKQIGSNDEDYQLQNEIAELRESLREVRDEADISDLRKSKDSLFGEDAWGLLVTNIDIAKKALTDFSQSQSDLISSGGYLGNNMDAFFKDVLDPVNSLEDAIGRMQVKTKDAKKFLGIRYKGPQYTSLKDLAPELYGKDGALSMPALKEFMNSDMFNKLGEQNKQLIKNLVDDWEDYNAAIEEVKNNFKSLFSDIGADVMDSMVEMFQGGEDAIDHFNETWDSMIENMIKSMLFSNMIQPEIDKLTEQLEKDGFFSDPTANINKAIKSIAEAKDTIFAKKDSLNAALQSFSDLGDKNGLNLFKKVEKDESEDQDKKTLSGAIKGASQESIDLLAGQTNAVRVNQVESISIMRQQLAANVEINISVIKNGVILSNILDEIRSSGNLRSQGLDV